MQEECKFRNSRGPHRVTGLPGLYLSTVREEGTSSGCPPGDRECVSHRVKLPMEGDASLRLIVFLTA